MTCRVCIFVQIVILLLFSWLLFMLFSFFPFSKGTVKLVFQPGEEGLAGAYHMLQEGALEDVQAIFGIHVEPSLSTGAIASRSGPLLAASGRFTATIKGKGGHAAFPHTTIDPILPASFAILSLQQLISRESDPLESRVSPLSSELIIFDIFSVE